MSIELLSDEQPPVAAAPCPQCGFDFDGDPPPAAPCPSCGGAARDKYCGSCGTEVETGREFAGGHHHEKTAKQAMRVMFAPVFEYFEHAGALVHTRVLVHEIHERHFTGIDVTGLWVAAALLAALFGAFVPGAVERVEIPVLAEVLEALTAMVVMTALYGPLHLLLRRGHRQVTFREYLITTLSIGGLLWPWLQLGQGIAMRFGMTANSYNNYSLFVAIVFYARAFGPLYHRRLRSVFSWIAAYIAAALTIVVCVAVVIALYHKFTGTPVRPAAPATVKGNLQRTRDVPKPSRAVPASAGLADKARHD